MNPILILRTEIVSLILLIYLTFVSRSFRMGKDGRTFSLILSFAMLHVIMDGVTMWSVNHPAETPVWTDDLFHIVLYLSAMLFSAEIMIYVANLSWPGNSLKIRFVADGLIVLAAGGMVSGLLTIRYEQFNGTRASTGGALASAGATFAAPGGDGKAVSGFLGALFAGFIAGWLLKMLEKACDHLPNALEGIKPVLIYPLAGLGIVGVMMCAVNPVMGIINNALVDGVTWMADQPALLIPVCALLAGMMAIDMGGPFNKAAYVTATTLLSSGTDASYKIMAAVMIGGMVPPLVIALNTIIFKKRWSAEERKNGPVNIVMGLSFITEGAIPYAAGHPLQVIPSCLVGSACAGALSALFGCTLMAPHGGIFVLPTIGSPALYFLALVIGAVVGTLLLAVLKKPVKE